MRIKAESKMFKNSFSYKDRWQVGRRRYSRFSIGGIPGLDVNNK